MKRAHLGVKDYIDGILKGDFSVLSRAITLVESKNSNHQKMAKELIHQLIPKTGKAKRIGISGTPGVGKSTFIESFGMYLCDQGLKVAVLAIDPTSQLTGGSILGDKTRMGKLSAHKNSFVRPSPSGQTLGGVANKTREAMLLCEAFGYDVIIIETVGVGQSEITVSKIVDFFLLLMQPGGGDDLQGIKRGILEIADLVAVNKADGDQLKQAQLAKREYEGALHILRQDKIWNPRVLTCSGLTASGLEDIWKSIQDFYQQTNQDKFLLDKRVEQLELWVWDLLMEKINHHLKKDLDLENELKRSMINIKNHKMSVLDVVDSLFDKVMENK